MSMQIVAGRHEYGPTETVYFEAVERHVAAARAGEYDLSVSARQHVIAIWRLTNAALGEHLEHCPSCTETEVTSEHRG